MMQSPECSVCHEWAEPTGEETWGAHRDALVAEGWTFPFPVVCPRCTAAHNEWFQSIYKDKTPGWSPQAKKLVLRKASERK